MKVVFVQDNGINESLLITELSAFLKANGHDASVVLEREEPDFRGALAADNPDLFFIPSSVLAHHWVLRTCEKLQEWFPGVPRVLAGTHPTFYPDILDFDIVHMVMIGEVEYATVELLDALAGKRPMDNIANLHFKQGKKIVRNNIRPLLQNLDELPLPDRGLYFDRYPFMARFPWKKFTSGRGCFHSCSYCYQPSYREMSGGLNGYIRRKSPRRVVDEVKDVAARYGLGNAHFSDDLFVTSVKWLREFSELYKEEVGTRYTMNCTPELITEESARLLGRSGCKSIAIGVETVDENLRKAILNKQVDNAVIRKAADLIRSNGMKLVTFNMLAMPGESIENSIATMKFNADIGADYARVSICFPLPGTQLARMAQEQDATIEGYENDIYTLPDLSDAKMSVGFKAAVPEQHKFINLYYLFNLGITFPFLIPVIERLIKLPVNPLFAALNLMRMLKERAVFNFSYLQGWSYFRHVGMPDKRTANFVGLV